MKIAQLAPLAERVPPKKYGGTERIVSVLTEELVKRGHEVTLFASGDSVTSARLESVFPRNLREAHLRDVYGMNYWTLLNIGMVYELQQEFDIIHDHLAPLSLPVANIADTPTLMTMHHTFTVDDRRLFQSLRNPPIVTISQSQLYTLPNINHAGTVYHGLPLQDFPFSEEADDYLLHVGRISLDKGTHFAIEVAQMLDKRLIIAAKLEPTDREYFKAYVEPRLSSRIEWIGEVDEEERNKLMSKALCLLHPITFREPFGLVMIEAMACGCPVIGFNRGSVAEIVKTGATGYVVEDTEGMLGALESIESIDRRACREHVLEHFTVEKMADGYEALYRKILGMES